ncbi:hypothetical protein PTKIN_Ptkin10aG0201000 [Pterospermum kingtungense]
MAPFCMRDRSLHNKGITKKCLKLQPKATKKNGRKNVVMQERLNRLKAEMEEISQEQKNIREGQRQVRNKFEAIESECQHLITETKMMMQQSATTQLKLALMFGILKAREEGDVATAANLTCLLR